MTDGDGHEGTVISTFSQPVTLSDEDRHWMGVLSDFPIVRVDDDFSHWERHRALRFVSFGNVIPEAAVRPGLRIRQYSRGTELVSTVLLTLQCVEVEGYEPYGELRFREGDTDVSLVRVNLNRPLDVLEPVRSALRVAVGLKISRRGKHRGDGATWAGGRSDFLDDLWTTLETLTRESGTPYGHDPASRRFRSRMRESSSARTMRDWLREKAKVRPRDVKSGAVTRANYSQFVAK